MSAHRQPRHGQPRGGGRAGQRRRRPVPHRRRRRTRTCRSATAASSSASASATGSGRTSATTPRPARAWPTATRRPATRCAAQACFGNEVTVRTGAAAGARGHGPRQARRGGPGHRHLRAGRAGPAAARRHQVAVRSRGQGAADPAPGVTLLNIDPDLLGALPVSPCAGVLEVGVRAVLPSLIVGNGIGRPTPMWDLDLQLTPATAGRYEAAGLRLGDLVAIDRPRRPVQRRVPPGLAQRRADRPRRQPAARPRARRHRDRHRPGRRLRGPRRRRRAPRADRGGAGQRDNGAGAR